MRRLHKCLSLTFEIDKEKQHRLKKIQIVKQCVEVMCIEEVTFYLRNFFDIFFPNHLL